MRFVVSKLRVRFSLRSLLLAMAVLCCLAALVGYETKWMRQRRAFREHSEFSFVESSVDSSDPRQPRAPIFLRLFGEPGMAFMTMEVTEKRTAIFRGWRSRAEDGARIKVLEAAGAFSRGRHLCDRRER